MRSWRTRPKYQACSRPMISTLHNAAFKITRKRARASTSRFRKVAPTWVPVSASLFAFAELSSARTRSLYLMKPRQTLTSWQNKRFSSWLSKSFRKAQSSQLLIVWTRLSRATKCWFSTTVRYLSMTLHKRSWKTLSHTSLTCWKSLSKRRTLVRPSDCS